LRERLEQLLEGHGRGLYALILRMTLDREAAGELFQELFARLAGSKGFAGAEDDAAFAFRVAMNLAHDWRRTRRRERWTSRLTEEVVAPVVAGLGLGDGEELERVLDGVGKLGQPGRDAVCMRYLMQMSYEEVGRVIGRTGHQARALCHTSIVRVRTMLEEGQVDRVTRRAE